MKNLFAWNVAAVVVVALSGVTSAEEPAQLFAAPTPGTSAAQPVAQANSGKPIRPPVMPVFNGFAMIRASADQGAPGSAGSAFPHYTMPLHQYTHWYRPRAATLTACQRCAPDSFRPRGLGHPFARPCDGYRMEYTPFSLTDEPSVYGPAYIARQPDPRCEHCDPTSPSGGH